MASISALVLWLAFRSFDAEARHQRDSLAERLEPVEESDHAWLGTFRLAHGHVLTFRADGWYFETSLVFGGSDLPPSTEKETGRWSRAGSTITMSPEERARPRELELGRVDGEYVLLGPHAVWRQESQAP